METIMASQTIARQYKEGAGVEIIFSNNGIVVGKACTVVYNGKPNAFLHGFEVKKQYRRNGYGTQILEYMIKNFDVEILYVDRNSEAISLYKRFGFEIIRMFDKNFIVMQRRR